jgi:hypothetical protein
MRTRLFLFIFFVGAVLFLASLNHAAAQNAPSQLMAGGSVAFSPAAKLLQGCEALDFGEVPAHQATYTIGSDDCYTFEGTTGDVVRGTITTISGSFYGELEIIGPDSVSVCTYWGEITCTLPLTGTYTLLVTGYDNGTYKLYIQRLNNPVGCTSLTFGNKPAYASSYPIGDVHCYTFNAAANDQLRAKITTTSGSFNGELEIISPDGVPLCEYWGEVSCVAVLSGKHMIFVTSSSNGTYKLYVQRLNNVVGCTVLAFGATLSASYAVGDVDCYRFNTAANDRLRVTITTTSGSFFGELEVISPDGVPLCEDWGEVICRTVLSGKHALLVTSMSNGSYKVSLTCLSGSCLPPAKPTLKLPPNNSTTADSTPRLCWNKAARAAQYRLQVDNDANFASPIIDVTQSALCYTSTTTLTDRKYYWHVRGRTATGQWGSWSARWAFTVNAVPIVAEAQPTALASTATAIPTRTPTAPPTTTLTVTPGPTGTLLQLVESGHPAVRQSGLWTAHPTNAASGGSYLYSSGSLDDSLTLAFSGTQVTIVYVRHPALGTFAVEIDGLPMLTVDSVASETQFGAEATITGLSDTAHILRIYPVSGVIALDAFTLGALLELPAPTVVPTDIPTIAETPIPPTVTDQPTLVPTGTPLPTDIPTDIPTETPVPTDLPTLAPEATAES